MSNAASLTQYGTGTLFGAIHDYLKVYMPKQRNMSIHTQNSYRVALDQLVDFVKLRNGIAITDVTFEMLTTDTVTAFLDSLESDLGHGVSSRNTRLAAIKAFMKYAAERNICNVAILQEVRNVALKKANKVEVVEYMPMEAISAIVEQTDLASPLGLRDRTLLILLYDTAARVDELVGINLCDLQFGKHPKVRLFGKWRKERDVPLLDRTVQYLRLYLAKFHADMPMASKSPLFYSVSHGERYALSDRRIRYLLKDYGDKARAFCSTVPANVHPHMFRHSRAMHLYQGGMDLTLVSQWLGHAHLDTTRVYAHADTEHKRTAIAKATPENSPLFSKLDPERYTVTDEDALKRLCGLRK